MKIESLSLAAITMLIVAVCGCHQERESQKTAIQTKSDLSNSPAPSSKESSVEEGSVQLSNLPNGRRIFREPKSGVSLVEEEVDSFSMFWMSEILTRHPELRKELVNATDLSSKTIASEDLRIIRKLFDQSLELKDFVVSDSGHQVQFFSNSAVILIRGNVRFDTFNAYFIRVPSGKWIFLEKRLM